MKFKHNFWVPNLKQAGTFNFSDSKLKKKKSHAMNAIHFGVKFWRVKISWQQIGAERNFKIIMAEDGVNIADSWEEIDENQVLLLKFTLFKSFLKGKRLGCRIPTKLS